MILVAGARDTSAIQIKLDELIRAVENADDRLVGIEERSAEELELIRQDRQPPAGANVGNETGGLAARSVARSTSC